MTWWSAVLVFLAAAGAAALAVALLLQALVHVRGLRERRTALRALDVALATELERARRHQRPLTLVRIDAPQLADRDDEDLSIQLRRTDHVYAAGRSVYVLAPETDRASADRLAKRLATQLDLDEQEHVQVACFPEDEVSSGALLGRLSGHEAGGPGVGGRHGGARPDLGGARADLGGPGQRRRRVGGTGGSDGRHAIGLPDGSMAG